MLVLETVAFVLLPARAQFVRYHIILSIILALLAKKH